MNILLRIIHNSAFKSLFTLALLLFSLNAIFSIKKESKSYLSVKKSVHSTFYVSGSTPLNNQKDIPLWASFYSPAIFIRANSPMNYTYSLMSQNQKIVNYSDENNDQYKFITHSLAEYNFMKRHFSLAQVLYDNYQPFPIGNKRMPEKTVVKQLRIYFMTAAGIAIPGLPSFQKFEITPTVERTILQVRGLDTKMPLVILTQSSTSQQLDHKALSAIKHALLKTKTRKALQVAIQSNQGILEIDWRMN